MQFGQIQRRKFITLLGSATVTWPLSARAPSRAKRCGGWVSCMITSPPMRTDSGKVRHFVRRCRSWDGPTARMCRSTIDRAPPTTIYCAATRPKSRLSRADVVFTSGATITASLQRASRTVSIVFVNVTDPVGAGLVASLARPGGHATGFTQFEFGISAKWLELLQEMAPAITRGAVIRDPTARTGGGRLGRCRR